MTLEQADRAADAGWPVPGQCVALVSQRGAVAAPAPAERAWPGSRAREAPPGSTSAGTRESALSCRELCPGDARSPLCGPGPRTPADAA